ncbi:hypothetical protein E2R51_14245 [Jeotgalibacillus sp. S-D1]|uniref:IucA/IucC family C-terminal-domain containing protein n=1 Tax=Jeotgalibacillus sp. S-D1 TaxID=2552189 RepID=UPI00105A4321|nr:IucA/IucC family C-terminal-domain containing protein [Jeotgalibacillus sp. S-D1]TDL31518.1 hypothetical protein E2R51_14245 [Jeotgalibacillus sp. S-D1]
MDNQLANYISEKTAVSFGNPKSSHVWNVSSWDDPAIAALQLEEIQRLQEAPRAKVTGSLVMKRVSFAYIGALLAYYRSGKVWDLNRSTINLAFDEDEPFNLMPVITEAAEAADASAKNWENVLVDNFHHWLLPLIETLEKTCRVQQIVLWENVFIYLKWFYEKLAPSLPELEQADWNGHWGKITDDTFFGESASNAFAYLNTVKSKRVMENGMRVRHTCCYKHQLPNSRKCSTCCQIKA